MALFENDDRYQDNCDELEFVYGKQNELDEDENENANDICDPRQQQEQQFQTDPLRKPVSRRVSMPILNNKNSNDNVGIPEPVESFGQSSALQQQQHKQRQYMGQRRFSTQSVSTARTGISGLRRLLGSSKSSSRTLLGNDDDVAYNLSNSEEFDAQVLAKYHAMDQRREQHLRRLAARKILIQRELNRRMVQIQQKSDLWGQRGIPNNIEFRQNSIQQRRGIPSNNGMNTNNNSLRTNRGTTFSRNNLQTLNDDPFLPQFQQAENEMKLLSSSLVSPEANRYYNIDSPLTNVNITNPEDCMNRIDDYQFHIQDRLSSESKIRMMDENNIDSIQFGTNNVVRDGKCQLQVPSTITQRVRQDNIMNFLPLETTIDVLVADSELINREHKGMVPESIYVAVGQMKLCGYGIEFD
jgi:hypothetical protein